MASSEQGYPWRYAQLLSRLLGVKGEQLSEVSPELILGLILENDRIEYSHLAEEAVASGDLIVGASAGNISQTGVLNPAGSGILITVEGVIGLTSALLIRLPTSLLGFGAITPGIPRDTRRASGRVVGQMASRQAAAAAGNQIAALSNANPVLFPPRGLAVLQPGTAIAADPNVVNTAAEATWFWRERPLEVSEAKQ